MRAREPSRFVGTAHGRGETGASRCNGCIAEKDSALYSAILLSKTNAAIAVILLTGLLVKISGQAKQEVDRTFDGLKGNVKTVSKELVDYGFNEKGEWIEKPRVATAKTAYDELGNQTRSEEFGDDGELSHTLVYHFIGKQRVATFIEASTSNALVRVVPLPKRLKIDPRYSYRYVHRYDAQGRRIQTLVYLSSGTLWLRHVFKFAANRKTHLVYTKGELNLKLEYTFDERGNESSIVAEAKYVADDKTFYKYDEFDDRGNWTKRTVYKGLKESADSEITRKHPWSVEYRMITYY